ncbi:MAG: 50S ribosomal protein L11 methyltransferase [Chloroflexota bacterium]
MTHRQRSFIRHWTRLAVPPLVPEVRLQLADHVMPLWEALARDAAEPELPPPYWAFAWAGGQALARYLLDHPHVVVGRRIVDLATGSGLCAIAALRAGAREALAIDIDPWAREAVALNAAANAVHVSFVEGDPLGAGPPDADVVLAGDIGYEWALAERGVAWLRRAAAQGAEVLVGDPEREHLDRVGLEMVGVYEVPTTIDLEQAMSKRTTVYRLTKGS